MTVNQGRPTHHRSAPPRIAVGSSVDGAGRDEEDLGRSGDEMCRSR